MSSAQLSTTLIGLQQNNYGTLAVLTTVVYDYVLTLSDEVEYIWNKPWSFVSTLFLFVRYLGILNLITCALLGSSFLPGIVKSYVFFLPLSSRVPNTADACCTALQGDALYIINAWIFYLYLGAADCVMSLRVWAMYNRSKLIFKTLVTIFFLDVISSFIRAALHSSLKNVSAPTVRIADESFCSVMSIPVWSSGAVVFQMAHGAALCLLTIVQFVSQSIQMYHVTKQWQTNRYINLLAGQGIFYFFALFLYDVIIVLSDMGKLPVAGWRWIVLTILNFVPVYTLTPRFIMSIRALYAHDVRTGCGEGIDTGFGLSVSTPNGTGSVLIFAEVQQRGKLEEEAFGEDNAVQEV